MRSATVIVVQCQPTASAPDIAKKHSNGKRAALMVMVLGALLQFIKRICILMVGLLRLSYRKVREGVPGGSISRLCNAAWLGCDMLEQLKVVSSYCLLLERYVAGLIRLCYA